MRIGVVGDFDPASETHAATNAALAHAAAALDVELDIGWLPTPDIDEATLARCRGLFVAPGSPYRSMDGALHAIRCARERDVPLLGTCGGFQHVIVEYARNVAGLPDADHAEYRADATCAVIAPLACSLAGETRTVRLVEGTRARATYGSPRASEPYRCTFGLSPQYRARLEDAGLRVSGVDDEEEARVVEFPNHPFFLATLYVPQRRSSAAEPHPLVLGLLRALV